MESLNEIIDKHFAAVKNRDINNLLETVDYQNITLILPNGNLSESFEDYKKINQDWFADNDWSIDYKIVKKIIKSTTAIVLTEITYFDKNEKGENYSFQYYLTLIFEQQAEEWKLIFDQNTIIR